MKTKQAASLRSRHVQLTTLAFVLCFFLSPTARSNLTHSGSVTDSDGNSWSEGEELHVGHSGFATFLLNNHLDGNGITSTYSGNAYVAYGDGTEATFTVRGPGALFQTGGNPGNLFIAEGANSRGTFTLAGGAQRIDADYSNHYIYVGRGAGSYGKLIITDSGTRLRLADWLVVGHLEGSSGKVIVESGAICDCSNIYVGYKPTAFGEIIVNGTGSTLIGWKNSYSAIGLNGNGKLTIENGGLAQLRALNVGYSNGSCGQVLVTGGGSRLENYYSSMIIGRGGGTAPGPGAGLVRLARSGVLWATGNLSVGDSSYNPDGTLVFTIGDHGGGTIGPGRADVDGTLTLNIAHLLMEVDPGITLTLGQQFVLVDYDTIHSTRNRFMDVPEGSVVVTPNHHAFQINYATDLGSGDLAITATVVPVPTTDADTDNLLDAWEIRCFGAIDDPRGDPALDPDGDGRTTANEHEAGTDPLDPASRCQSTVTENPVGAPWALAYSPYDPAVSYTIERATSITGPWSQVTPTATTIDGATILFTLPADAPGQAFYHVKMDR